MAFCCAPRSQNMRRLDSIRAEGEDEDDGFFMASMGSVALAAAFSGTGGAEHYPAPPGEMVVKAGQAEEAAWQTMVRMIAKAIESGKTTAWSNQHVLGRNIASGEDTKPEDVQRYFDGLSYQGKPGAAKSIGRSASVFRTQSKLGSLASVRLPSGRFLVEETDGKGLETADEKKKGIDMVDYRKYPMKGYVDLPSPIIGLLSATSMDYYLIVGRPSSASSAGLRGYREVTTKKERRDAPFIVVIDEPGMLEQYEDSKYIWVEFALGDVFMLDVSGMETIDDYMKVLSKKGRWNYKDRQKKFGKGPVEHELRNFDYTDKFIDMLWPLYAQTGEKNGFTVLTKEEFYDFHRKVPDLNVSLVWDVQDPANKKLVSFCTGVTWNDVIMPMWCGTDYENPLNRECATYFIMLYKFVEYGINTPGINTVDLGASHRSAKTAIGFSPVSFSGYFRCKNSFIQMFVEAFMNRYYRPEQLIHDM